MNWAVMAARYRVFRRVYLETTVDRIEELERKIFQVCSSCSHFRWVTGRFECTVKRSHCHSKRVRRWLDEIEKLES